LAENEFNDKELLRAAQQGSQAAFKQLYDKYWGDLFQIARRRVTSDEDAKDLLQEVFLSFYKNIQHLNTDDNIGGYLFVSLRNKIFNYYEQEQSRLKKLLSRPMVPVESEEEIFSRLQTKYIEAIIREALQQMPPRMKEIYLLSKEQQMTLAEISALLSISTQTVKNQLYRALQQIRNSLNDKKPGFFLLPF